MKLELSKGWFERNIPHDDPEVSAGLPGRNAGRERLDRGACQVEDAAGAMAFGVLMQLLRRDRKLSLEQLSNESRVDVAELLGIERDHRYIPRPRTVMQLSSFFGLPERSLVKLSNVTTVHDVRLRDAAVRFAASSSVVMELTREERVLLTDFVSWLSQDDG